MNFNDTHAWLEDRGYAVRFRVESWAECFVCVEGERWLGVGASEDEALGDVVSKMFPSRAARALLDHAVAELAARRDAPEVVAPVAPSVAPEAIAVAPEVVAPEVPAPQAPPTTPRAPPKVLDVRADPWLDEIDELLTEISAREGALAMSTPVRQRLVITGWIADARRAQDEFPEEERVRTMVSRVAARLSRLCRVWWCGSVRALQVDRRPEAVLSELPFRSDAVLHSWGDVVDLASQMLDRMEREDAAHGRDDYGWSDGDALSPPPADADAMLREVVAGIEAIAGSAETFPPRESPDAKLLARWVARLRWLRGALVDGATWAYALGRCRHWAERDRVKYAEVTAMLDPSYRPEAAWSTIFASQGKDRERRKLVKEVLSCAPAVKEHPGRPVLLAWLHRALPLADTHHKQIVELMTPFRAELAAIDASAVEGFDRRLRRRFSLLQRDLGADVAELPDASDVGQPESGDAVAEVIESVESPFLVAVRGRTHGSRALFISNRNDPMLQDRLLRVLEFSELDWCEADVKRTQAAEQKVAAGAYDFVLAATGFLSHSVDGRLAKVCRTHEVPYVRVERGRPMTCVRSLARDLGIRA